MARAPTWQHGPSRLPAWRGFTKDSTRGRRWTQHALSWALIMTAGGTRHDRPPADRGGPADARRGLALRPGVQSREEGLTLMRKWILVLAAALVATPALADKRVDDAVAKAESMADKGRQE